MNDLVQNINSWLINYLYQPGDSKETIMLKKIWWLFNIIGFPAVLFGSLIVGNKAGTGVVILNSIWICSIPLALLIFHFHKKGIEWYALAVQICLVLFAFIKVYMLGGLLNAGGPIFFGLIGPLYALTLPNKKRAVYIYMMYAVLMISATLLQPEITVDYMLYLYFLGFILGTAMAFAGLYYYTLQVEKLKRDEKKRMRELDEFKTKFYTHITHEFRTPLTVILGMADQIKSQPEQWFNEGLKMIKHNGRKLLNLTNQMLDLSKLEAKAMPVNLIQDDIAIYLKYLVESFQSLASTKNIDILFSAKPEVIEMDYDPEKIQDILSNLLSNAIKFTPENGFINVTVTVNDKAEGSQMIMSVKDTGKGIPSEYLPKIFDRYFQAEDHNGLWNEGSGLGLALTRELVHLLRGKITVKSSLNKGSIFTVQLPITHIAPRKHEPFLEEISLREIQAENAGLTTMISTNEASDKLLLLIVEDNDDVVHYLHSMLSDDYAIEVAGNGKEGFDKAVQIIPDLVLSDVMMPEMDGFVLCEKLKSDLRTSHIPVILLTARADAESKIGGLKAGADVYLAKPFKREELFVRIEKLIELRKSLQQRYKAIANLKEGLVSIAGPELPKEDKFIGKVRQTLEDHLSEEEFGIAELCSSLAMSRSQLYRKFAALTDTSVHRFIRKLRLEKAKELLESTDLNVSEVAYDTGFKNPSHFSRVFSEEFGIAPSKTRFGNKVESSDPI